MRTNKTKAKLRTGKMVLGCWLGFHAPAVVEILASAGVDCALLDAEHGGLAASQVEDMVRAAEAFDITPIVRVPNHDPATIYGYLDRGAQGVVVPHVNNGIEARQVARAARYHPQGQRGYMTSHRPAGWGTIEPSEYMRQANEEVLVIAMVEDQAAVQNLDDILATDGVDMIMLGPGDLAQSMGWPPSEQVEQVLQDVTRRVVAAGKWVSEGAVAPGADTDAIRYIRLGSRFWNVPCQQLLRRGAQAYMDWLRELGAPL
jgi:4-hydroxy-2-oxoheptanedioate aldolase